MTHRIDNFCAGPCTLPLSVLQSAQAELTNFNNSGMSVMEISHRSKLFDPIHDEAIALARQLIDAPEEFAVLFLTGGASQQFAMSAMNLLTPDNSAGIVNSGVWAKKALAEGKRIGNMVEAWSGESSNFTTLPNSADIVLPDNARYLHLTSNETIGGIQWQTFPDVSVPLVIDASSDYYSRPIPWQKCDIVYGGVQKNLAPSGLSLVFVRHSLLQDHPQLPAFFNYQTHAKHNSLYNTPPTWQIYLLGKVLNWMQAQGGIATFQARAQAKSSALYQAIDASDFYHNNIAPEYRSTMNVVYRTPSEALDTLFWQRAEQAGLSGLKGHRVVGGIRASLYNALEMASVERLIDFMHQFERQHG